MLDESGEARLEVERISDSMDQNIECSARLPYNVLT
jgi:hypothetical protein